MAKRYSFLTGHGGRSLVYPGLLVLLGLGFALYPLAKGEIFFYWDNAQQHYAQTAFLHQWLGLGKIPHWWPEVGSGMPVVAEGQAAHFHPVRFLFAWIFPPPVAFMGEIGFYLAIAGLSTYFFLREFRLSRLACLVGGLSQMFGSFSIVYIRNMALHRSLSLLPLAMFFAERFVSRRSIPYGLGASFVIGVQLLSGHPTFAIVTIVATSVYVISRQIQRHWHKAEPFGSSILKVFYSVTQWGFVLLFGFGIAAVQVLPTLKHIEQSIRTGGLNFHYAVGTLPAKLKYLPQLLFPYIYYQGDSFKVPASWGGYFNEVPTAGIYIGALPVVLIILCFWWRRRRLEPTIPLAACLLVAMGLALGPKTPLFPALWSLPGLDGMRYPSRFLMWASFSLSCLAAVGLHKLLIQNRLRKWSIKTFAPFLLITGIVLLLALLLLAMKSTVVAKVPISVDYNAGIITSLALFAIALTLAFVLLVVRRRYHPTISILIVLFVAADLLLFRSWSGYAPTFRISEVLKLPHAAEFLKKDTKKFRVLSVIPAEMGLNRNADLFDFVQADTCTIWGIESANVYCSLMLKRYYAVTESVLWELSDSPGSAEKLRGFLGALNIKYVVAPGSTDLLGWVRVHQTDRVAVWENPSFLPRAFLVGDIVPENLETKKGWFQKSTYERLAAYRAMVFDWSPRAMDAQVVDNILNSDVDYSTTAVVEGKDLPTLSGLTPGASVRMGESGPDVMRFEVETEKPALLVISSNYYPGWTAEVNGKSAPIYRTNFVSTGVLVPQGRSEVVLSFVTPGFRHGLVFTIIFVMISLGGMIFIRWTEKGRLFENRLRRLSS